MEHTKLRQFIGYGVVPSLLIMIGYYVFYFSTWLSGIINISFFNPAILTFVLLMILFISTKKYYNAPIFLYYSGFKFLSVPLRILYFSFTYLLLLGVVKLINPQFLDCFNNKFLFIFPLVAMLILLFITKYLIFQVIFIRVTPNIYYELVNHTFHSLEQIKEYNIKPNYDHSLTKDKLDIVINFFENTRKIDTNIMVFDFNTYAIDRIEHSYNKTNHNFRFIAYDINNVELWDETFLLGSIEEYNEDKINELKKSIIYLENL